MPVRPSTAGWMRATRGSATGGGRVCGAADCSCPSGDSCDYVCRGLGCVASCGANATCSVQVQEGTASIACGRDATCSVAVLADAVLSLECGRGGVCRAECQDVAICAVDCDFESACDLVCAPGTDCRMDCDRGACLCRGTACAFSACSDGAPRSCPDDVVACGRPCP
jgi:hypothetical protein